MSTTQWQQPQGVYSQKDGDKTTDYMARKDAEVSKESSKISNQQYKGRY